MSPSSGAASSVSPSRGARPSAACAWSCSNAATRGPDLVGRRRDARADHRGAGRPSAHAGAVAGQRTAYPEFVAELRDGVGARPRLPRLRHAAGRARRATRPRRSSASSRCARRLGLAVHRLRPSEARRLEPALAPTLRLALEVPDDHAIDPRALTAALGSALTARRGRAPDRDRGDRGRASHDGRVTGVRLAAGEQVAAEQVVIAAGAWSGSIAGLPEDARVPIHPVKGQILRLHDPSGPGLLTRVLRMTGGYLVPRGDGRYVLGATMEERGFDTTVTAGAVFELLRDAIELVPGVAELVIDELVAGLRPGDAGQRSGDRPRRGRGPALGDRPLPPRDPARADHRRCRSRRRSPARSRPSSRRRSRRAVRRRGGGRMNVLSSTARSASSRPARPWPSVVASLPGRARRPRRRGRRRRRGRAARAEWPSTELRDGRTVEVVVAVQGG